jgi:hypothetical protein
MSTRISGANPSEAIKFILDNWYTKPNPIIRVPIDMPYLGLLNVIRAIRMHMMIGNGCGKSGRNDRPKIILTNVRTTVMILSGAGSSARILSSFSFPFCLCLLYHARAREMVESLGDFNVNHLKLYFTNCL